MSVVAVCCRDVMAVPEAAERAESSGPARMPEIPEISLLPTLDGSDLQHEAALLMPPTDNAAVLRHSSCCCDRTSPDSPAG